MTQNTATDKSIRNGKIDETAAAVKERATDTLEKGKEVAQDAVAHAQLATEQAGIEIRKMTESSTDFVRENPGAAIAGAVGVGILVGLALRSRS